MSWYWATGQVFFACFVVLTGCAAFVCGLVFLMSIEYRDSSEKAVIRWTARLAFLMPLAAALSLVAWPLIAASVLIPAGMFFYRLAWTEPPAEKAERLRREQRERDAEIARLEREAGIR